MLANIESGTERQGPAPRDDTAQLYWMGLRPGACCDGKPRSGDDGSELIVRPAAAAMSGDLQAAFGSRSSARRLPSVFRFRSEFPLNSEFLSYVFEEWFEPGPHLLDHSSVRA